MLRLFFGILVNQKNISESGQNFFILGVQFCFILQFILRNSIYNQPGCDVF
jgi:uncharacterized membrane protein